MYLVPIRQSDVASVFSLWSDAEATWLTNWVHVSTLDECDAKLERVLAHYSKEPRHFGPYTIKGENNEFIGIAGADLIDETDGCFEIWYFVRRELWGKGIGRASVQILLDTLTQSGRVRRVSAEAVPQNTASWKLLERAGFKRFNLRKGGHRNTGLDVYEYEMDLQPPRAAF